jgi:hypothetical protein
MIEQAPGEQSHHRVSSAARTQIRGAALATMARSKAGVAIGHSTDSGKEIDRPE